MSRPLPEGFLNYLDRRVETGVELLLVHPIFIHFGRGWGFSNPCFHIHGEEGFEFLPEGSPVLIGDYVPR
jgi:hypothetical protein